MTDKETLRKEFESFVFPQGLNLLRRYDEPEQYASYNTLVAFRIWLEATKRADRKAREECEDICRQIGCAETQNDKRYVGAFDCAKAIFATIPEDK